MIARTAAALRAPQGQALTLAAGQLLITVIATLTGLAIARRLAPAEYGQFLTYARLLGLLRLFLALGLTSLVIYELAPLRGDPAAVERALRPLWLLRLVTLIALLGPALLVALRRVDAPLVLTALTAAAALLLDYCLGVLQGLGRPGRAIGVLLLQPLAFGLALAVIGLAPRPLAYLYRAQLASFLGALALALHWTRAYLPGRRPEKVRWRAALGRALRLAGGFYLIAILLTLFSACPTLLLGAAGRYEAAAHLTVPLNTVGLVPGVFALAMTAVYFPRLIRRHSQGQTEAARHAFEEYLRLSGPGSVFVALCLLAYPVVCLQLLYGGRYAASARYLVVLAPTVVLTTLGTGLLWAVVAQGRTRAALPGVAVPALALAGLMAAIVRWWPAPGDALLPLALVYTAATALLAVWQLRLLGYSLRPALAANGRYALLALALLVPIRAAVADAPADAPKVAALLALAGLLFAAAVLRAEFGLSLQARRARPVIALAALLLLSAPAASAQTEPLPPAIIVTASPNLPAVAAGEPGVAWLLYHSPAAGPACPRLAVRLAKPAPNALAEALVYDTPAGDDCVPLTGSDDWAALAVGPIPPALRLVAPDGWWARDGRANYNLDVTVYGPIVAMWGATEWPALLSPGDPAAQIIVRDPSADGLPDWDWRTMLPEFPNRGDARTNYAERQCPSPVAVDPGLSPAWPYVARGGGFEQTVGRFRPPIVVDWAAGRVAAFAELVTVRRQNCAYALYSIARVLPGVLNRPNFETPFAFYDLSGRGVGYPNLLLRTQRTLAGDRALYLSGNPETLSVRYSWRNAVGDGTWDYKIDVLGPHRFDFATPIAGGAALIDAPSYAAYPAWVVGRDWPAASFVALEGAGYRSSEGIYEWSMLDLSPAYAYGWAVEPDLSYLADIPAGHRGEYRLSAAHPPELYLSPIDNRLHLQWAEHGLWRLNDGQIIRLANLDGDATLDVWSREALPVPAGAPSEPPATGAVAPAVIETLYALDGYLLHAGGARVALVAAAYEPARFETRPPTDPAAWQAHRAALAPYVAQRRDPADLRGWLDAFPGPRAEIAGASLANLRPTDGGFRFELTLSPGFVVSGPDLPGLAGLPPGDYLVERRDGAFHVRPLTPPVLALAAPPAGPLLESPEIHQTARLTLDLANSGRQDAARVVVSAAATDPDGARMPIAEREIAVASGATRRVAFDWIPAAAGPHALAVRAAAYDAAGRLLAEAEWSAAVVVARPPATAAPDALSAFGLVPAPAILLLAACALFAVGLFVVYWRRAGEAA